MTLGLTYQWQVIKDLGVRVSINVEGVIGGRPAVGAGAATEIFLMAHSILPTGRVLATSLCYGL